MDTGVSAEVCGMRAVNRTSDPWAQIQMDTGISVEENALTEQLGGLAHRHTDKLVRATTTAGTTTEHLQGLSRGECESVVI